MRTAAVMNPRWATIEATVIRVGGRREGLGIVSYGVFVPERKRSGILPEALLRILADERGMATLQVNTGRAVVTALLAGGVTYPKFIDWGTGAGTTAATDTTLFTAAAEARVSGTQSQITTTTTSDTYQCVGTITSASAQTITNAGIFDAAGTGSPPTGGNLYVKGDFVGIALAINDSIQFTFQVAYA